MSEMRTYSGGCRCGRVRYDATTSLETVLSCNCSLCQKRGVLWNYVEPGRFTLLSGGDALSDYQFNNKIIHHVFCRHCGVGSFSHGPAPDGRDVFAINVICLDDVDLGALTLTPFDGRSL